MHSSIFLITACESTIMSIKISVKKCQVMNSPIEKKDKQRVQLLNKCYREVLDLYMYNKPPVLQYSVQMLPFSHTKYNFPHYPRCN